MLHLLERGVGEVFFKKISVHVERMRLREPLNSEEKIIPFSIQNVNPDGVTNRKIK